jgi:protein phosphatase
MGGHASGDIASRAVIDALRDLPATPHLGSRMAALEARLQAINGWLLDEAGRRGAALMGTTLALLLISGAQGVYLWVGDSRVYQYRNGQLRQLTRDHNLVAELLAAGQPLPKGVDADATNLISRALGGGPHLEPEAEMLEVRPGDRYLLCSDGLNKELSDAEIAATLARCPGMDAAQELLDQALAARGRDNISLILVAAAEELPST